MAKKSYVPRFMRGIQRMFIGAKEVQINKKVVLDTAHKSAVRSGTLVKSR